MAKKIVILCTSIRKGFLVLENAVQLSFIQHCYKRLKKEKTQLLIALSLVVPWGNKYKGALIDTVNMHFGVAHNRFELGWICSFLHGKK